MQNKEKKGKKAGRPGYTDKRFWMRNPHKEAVEAFQKILEVKQNKDLKFEQALEHLVETHPATRKLMPL